MEKDFFDEICSRFISSNSDVNHGKMMSSPALQYQGKVFTFLSKNNKMVFKLGKGYDFKIQPTPMIEFNPFKNKGPLSGWFEVDYTYHPQWEPLTEQALNLIQSQL
jgi:hypothetical protein